MCKIKFARADGSAPRGARRPAAEVGRRARAARGGGDYVSISGKLNI